MTIFDLLFIALALSAIATLIVAASTAIRGRRARALTILLRLTFLATVYVGIVYIATALSKQTVRRIGDPQCFDDWCIAVDAAKRVPQEATARYDITLRIFSRARRVAQRENGAKDVYLVDADWKRYDPAPVSGEPPLSTLLQPGESVITRRTFELPSNAHDVGLMVDHGSGPLSICVVIGECGAFHKDTVLRID
jgi:hypothetical protein